MGWDYLIYAIISLIISYAISVATAPDPVDATEGKLDVPTAEEGTSIPVVFGEVLYKTPNVLWSGAASTSPIYSGGGK